MKVKSLWCVRLFVTPDLPGSSIHGILQARILEWVAISFFRGPSWPRDWTQVSCIAGRCINLWATREALYYVPFSWADFNQYPFILRNYNHEYNSFSDFCEFVQWISGWGWFWGTLVIIFYSGFSVGLNKYNFRNVEMWGQRMETQSKRNRCYLRWGKLGDSRNIENAVPCESISE